MQALKSILLLLFALCINTSTMAHRCIKTDCCRGMGGIHYCDSSAGRFVCRNGDFSTCYCTRHAVMDFQELKGCCLWQGGVVEDPDIYGMVVCRDGSISEICSMAVGPPVSSWEFPRRRTKRCLFR